MTDFQPTQANPDTLSTRRGRRAALAAGATAAIGAAGILLARPADAAAGSPLLLGRSNSAGSSNTLVSSSTTSVAFAVRGTGGHAFIGDCTVAGRWSVYGRSLATTAGAGGAVRGDGHANVGVFGITTNQNQYGIVALNTSAAAGDSGALVADGGANAGVVAFTEAPAGVNANPAIYADGGAGAWASWLLGDEVLDGTLFAAFNLVGVQDTANGIGYREAVSGEDPVHTQSGRATLDGSGTATVAMTASFLDAANLTAATTSVQLTAMATAMPDLAATMTSNGFTITGGAASGSVSWTITAPRRAPTTAAAAAGAKAGALLTSSKTMSARRTTSAPRRAAG